VVACLAFTSCRAHLGPIATVNKSGTFESDSTADIIGVREHACYLGGTLVDLAIFNFHGFELNAEKILL